MKLSKFCIVITNLNAVNLDKIIKSGLGAPKDLTLYYLPNMYIQL